MCEDYTRQALPSKRYRELLGSALCVFNSNNAFVIENILNCGDEKCDWYNLIDLESGTLAKRARKTFESCASDEVVERFEALVLKRNRIIHSFQVTENGEQILATKERETDEQFYITEDYLLKFIKENEELSSMLYELRDKLKQNNGI